MIEPLYTTRDTELALQLRLPLPYGRATEVAKGVQVTFHDAGHILGSAIVEVEVQDHHLQRRLVGLQAGYGIVERDVEAHRRFIHPFSCVSARVPAVRAAG